eukprot:TRINITY_DN57745_c0_g1_i1.p2 TRINITY_DN57745_c0_g1~~TRINITY_DN57745_c0_g1_i1.p2  ORF type:complete len:217 (+),score=23.09 TRINITY_DN57745_c0_g1_i1:103-753(+)
MMLHQRHHRASARFGGTEQTTCRRFSCVTLSVIIALLVVVVMTYRSWNVPDTMAPSGFYAMGLSARGNDGTVIPLSAFAGKVTLVVNVASLCGYTKSNYEQLNELHNRYAPAGLTILAFPCNQFGNQEPGSAVEIRTFALSRGAHFQLFDKVDVNGPATHPIYAALKSAAHIETVKWNFEKFLITREGALHHHYVSQDAPLSFEAEIVRLLAEEVR